MPPSLTHSHLLDIAAAVAERDDVVRLMKA